jgi:ankyrin repeat protein
MEIRTTEPLAQALTSAIHAGDVEALRQLLDAEPSISKARIVDPKGASRTLLHVAADWPGHFPNVAQTIGLLIERGADPDTPMVGGNAPERPLHWAASSNDVDALNALLDGGANIESPGAIFTNGTAMSDAVIFAQWNAARKLLDRGAKTTLAESEGSACRIVWPPSSNKGPDRRATKSPQRSGMPAGGGQWPYKSATRRMAETAGWIDARSSCR